MLKTSKFYILTLAAVLLLAGGAQAQFFGKKAETAPPPAVVAPTVPPAAAAVGTSTAAMPVIGPDFSALAERLLPTVVNVSTTQTIKEMAQPDMPEFPPGSPFEDFFKDFYDRHKNGPQTQTHPTSLGSGFVIDAKEGYIVTNSHVIKDADEIKVILHDDTSIEAQLVGTDEKTDIAVLKIKTDKPLTAADWGNSDESRVGSWTLVIGNPFGLGGTVTAGIVSARQRDINAGPYDDFIQTDASINRGNSGGPMFNTRGEVIGVSTAIFSPSGGSVGIGFAVPSSLAKPVVDQLIKFGKTKRGWLGVRIQVVTDDIAESLGLGSTEGALVSSVTPNGPAARSGIMAGDIVLDFNNHRIKQMRQLPRIVAETEINKKVPVTIIRKGQKKTIEVTLSQLEKAEEEGLIASNDNSRKEDKATAEKSTAIDDLGIKVAALSDELKARFDIKGNTKGVIIIDIDGNSPAAEKGLAPGDIIVEMDQIEIKTPEDVQARAREAKKSGRTSILMFIARQEDMRFIAIKLADKTKKPSLKNPGKTEEENLEEEHDKE